MSLPRPTSTPARAGLALGLATALALLVIVATPREVTQSTGPTDRPEPVVMGNVIEREPPAPPAPVAEVTTTAAPEPDDDSEATGDDAAPAGTDDETGPAPTTAAAPAPAPQPTEPRPTEPPATAAPAPPPPPTTSAPVPTQAAPPPAQEPPARQAPARIDLDIRGNDDLERIIIRVTGAGSGMLELPGRGGRAFFDPIPAGEWQLTAEYRSHTTGPDSGGNETGSQGIDRSVRFRLEPGGTLAGTWSVDGGWVLVTG